MIALRIVRSLDNSYVSENKDSPFMEIWIYVILLVALIGLSMAAHYFYQWYKRKKEREENEVTGFL